MNLSLFAGLVVVISALISTTSGHNTNAAWVNFKLTYNKVYRTMYEEAIHKSYFMKNYAKIQEHNERYKLGHVGYSLKVNKFADTNAEQISTLFNGYKPDTNEFGPKFAGEPFVPNESTLKKLPPSFDWRERGAVTPVKNQEGCAACWAFSATGAIEAQHYLKTGTLVSLSEQNLIDCANDPNDMGCNGGYMAAAFNYVHVNDGIASDDAYPYDAADTLRCRYDEAHNITSIKGFATIESGNVEHLKAAIATIGPVATGFDARNFDFHFYGDGIYDEDKYTLDINRAVLLVGYGTDEEFGDYWIIKNSWGASWGENGYMRVVDNKQNKFGIVTYPIVPLNY